MTNFPFKYAIKIFTIYVTYGLSMVWAWMFLLMYINGGSVLIICTKFNEQLIEYPMMALFVPLLTYGTWLIHKELNK